MPIMLAMMPRPSTISTMTEMKASRSNASLTSMPMTRTASLSCDVHRRMSEHHAHFRPSACPAFIVGLFDHLAEAENVGPMEEIEGDPEHGRDDRRDDRLADEVGTLGRAPLLALARVFQLADAQRQDREQHGPPDHQVDHEAGGPAHGALSLDLLEFDQRAREVLGMQEQHRLVMRADLGFAVAQHPRALGLELVAGGVDVLDLVPDMVDAAVGIAGEKVGDG